MCQTHVARMSAAADSTATADSVTAISVRVIPPQMVWPLRHEVMWPSKPLEYVVIPGDEDAATSRHFGLFLLDKDEPVSVVSLFWERREGQGVDESVAQFRKFCTRVSHQRKGYGTLLLERLVADARAGGAKSLWCNARVEQAGYYRKLGLYEVPGRAFEKDGQRYVIMEMPLRRPTAREK